MVCNGIYSLSKYHDKLSSKISPPNFPSIDTPTKLLNVSHQTFVRKINTLSLKRKTDETPLLQLKSLPLGRPVHYNTFPHIPSVLLFFQVIFFSDYPVDIFSEKVCVVSSEYLLSHHICSLVYLCVVLFVS